jgi:hypothetical protein
MYIHSQNTVCASYRLCNNSALTEQLGVAAKLQPCFSRDLRSRFESWPGIGYLAVHHEFFSAPSLE